MKNELLFIASIKARVTFLIFYIPLKTIQHALIWSVSRNWCDVPCNEFGWRARSLSTVFIGHNIVYNASQASRAQKLFRQMEADCCVHWHMWVHLCVWSSWKISIGAFELKCADNIFEMHRDYLDLSGFPSDERVFHACPSTPHVIASQPNRSWCF